MFSEHKYTKQYIAKTKYNLHNRVHRLYEFKLNLNFLHRHAMQCNELFFNK